MLSPCVADLHVHTVLSPCAEYRMVPSLIVQRAVDSGVGLIGVTDHNSGENAQAVVRAAKGSSVHVLPGMEVESREGVHLLALFDEIGALNRWQDAVYSALPPRQNDARLFGTQLVVDADGTLISVNQRLLATAAALSVEEVVRGVGLLGGLCIPAHVDRPANGLLGVLGMVPDGLGVPALEVSRNLSPQQAAQRFPQLKEITLVRSSDAHALEDVGKATTTFLIDELSVLEVSMACRGERGRLVA